MNFIRLSSVAASILAAAFLAGCTAADRDKAGPRPASASTTEDQGTVEKIIANWPERPRLGAVQMIAKYGAPQEITAERLIWNNPGPFKRIMVMNLETPHDFPLPHVDYMEHTINYNVPQNKVGDLIAFDASSTINRTVGELSARCDLEGHNVLTLNLDHDIVTGKKTVAEARKAFGEIVGQDVTGKHPAYVEGLQFKTMTATAFADKPVIPGSPLRAGDPAANGDGGDAEILASVFAIDLNEVNAAAEAQRKKMSQPVLDFAKMLHEAHGTNMTKTMELGQQMGSSPAITATVEGMQKKGAGELAALVMLDGEEFERAYLTAMVKGHEEALSMIDGQLLKTVKNGKLREHLTATRAHVAHHLEKAKELQGGRS